MFKTQKIPKSLHKIFFLMNKNFTSTADYHFLNPYLKDSLHALGKNLLKTNQINIVESINKIDTHSMILCDDFSGRKYSSLLGVMNRVLNSKEKSTSQNLIQKNPSPEIKEDEYFTNTKEILKKSKENYEKNQLKKELKPRGAIVICQKFEFATHFFRICRKLDFQSRLRLVRVGTSLHTVTPTVDLDTKYSDTDEQEEKEKEEMQLGNVNLINTTDWKNIDILFISPQMLEYISLQKDKFDYFDINPELVMVDDFDYILNSSKYDIKKHLQKFFSKESKFYSDISKHRKLVLSSSSLYTNEPIFKNNYDDIIRSSVEKCKTYLSQIDSDLIQKLDVVTSPNFMNFDFYTKGIKIKTNIFKDPQNILDKKMKHLSNMINTSHLNSEIIICCNEQNIAQVKEHLKKKKFNFVSVDEKDRVGQRLFSVMLYNKYVHNILLITPVFLKSLNIVKLSQLILFDFPTEFRDFLRILSKFQRKGDEGIENTCNLFLDSTESEKFSSVVEKLKISDKN